LETKCHGYKTPRLELQHLLLIIGFSKGPMLELGGINGLKIKPRQSTLMELGEL